MFLGTCIKNTRIHKINIRPDPGLFFYKEPAGPGYNFKNSIRANPNNILKLGPGRIRI